DAADREDLHLASRRGRPDALLALHRFDAGRLHTLGTGPRHRRPRGWEQLAQVEGPPPVPRLRGDRRPAGADRLRGDPAAARAGAGGDGRAGGLRGATGFMNASRAMVLGAVQGPAELLPVSSSAHLTLIPWLAGWETAEQRDPELQKCFEVALHAG